MEPAVWTQSSISCARLSRQQCSASRWCNQRDVEVFFPAGTLRRRRSCPDPAGGPEFEEEVAAAEDVLVLAGGGAGLVVVPIHDVAAPPRGKAAGEADEAGGVLCEERLGDARLAIEAAARPPRYPDQVAIALFVSASTSRWLYFNWGAVVVFLADVKLAAGMGLIPFSFAALKKMCTAP